MRRLISLTVSVIILAVIYWTIEFDGLIRILQASDGRLMAASLAMVVPLTVITAWRLRQLMPEDAALGSGEANRLILAASALNMVLPSKMGDIAKAYFITERGRLDGSLALALVMFEKGCDTLSLLLWCVLGLALYPERDPLFWTMTAVTVFGLLGGGLLLGSLGFAKLFFSLGRRIAPVRLGRKIEHVQGSWGQMQDYVRRDKVRLSKVTLTSVLIWFLHLLQIWLFILALRAWTPFLVNLALSPLAILAGLLPLTFAGVGTRDAALIFLYKPYLPPATAAALGLLCTSRYVLPAVGGLPFLGQYLSRARSFRGQADQSSPPTAG